MDLFLYFVQATATQKRPEDKQFEKSRFFKECALFTIHIAIHFDFERRASDFRKFSWQFIHCWSIVCSVCWGNCILWGATTISWIQNIFCEFQNCSKQNLRLSSEYIRSKYWVCNKIDVYWFRAHLLSSHMNHLKRIRK